MEKKEKYVSIRSLLTPHMRQMEEQIRDLCGHEFVMSDNFAEVFNVENGKATVTFPYRYNGMLYIYIGVQELTLGDAVRVYSMIRHNMKSVAIPTMHFVTTDGVVRVVGASLEELFSDYRIDEWIGV